MQTTTFSECLTIFENDILRRHRSAKQEIFAEELCLLFFFAVKNLQQDTPIAAVEALEQDKRLVTLLDLLFAKFSSLDFEYVLTCVWSLGILVSAYGYQIPLEAKVKILEQLGE